MRNWRNSSLEAPINWWRFTYLRCYCLLLFLNQFISHHNTVSCYSPSLTISNAPKEPICAFLRTQHLEPISRTSFTGEISRQTVREPATWRRTHALLKLVAQNAVLKLFNESLWVRKSYKYMVLDVACERVYTGFILNHIAFEMGTVRRSY
jgi:hypothetical protein